jgi:uncharacterized protein
MNSCLYKCTVMHNRLEPKKNRFHYSVFMFYLDLDEIDSISKKMLLMSRNRFNAFNFRDKDHLQLPKDAPDKSKSVKQHIIDYLGQNGVDIGKGKIMLLTNLCTLGYQFNPVSFYYCFNEAGEPVCSVVEVCNTFHEMKPYFIGKEQLKDNKFHLNTTKYFYVSPFIDMDANFDFNLYIPGEKLNVRIDDYKNGNRFFISTLTGHKKKLNDWRLLWYMLRFPLITLKVIGLIHWQALILWMKKVPHHKKNAHRELQKEVYRPYKS